MNVTGPKGLRPSTYASLTGCNMVPKEMVSGTTALTYCKQPYGRLLQRIINMAVVQITRSRSAYSPLPDKSATQNNNLGFGVTLLWNKTIPYPITTGNLTFNLGSLHVMACEVLIKLTKIAKSLFYGAKKHRQYWGYSLTDGSHAVGTNCSNTSSRLLRRRRMLRITIGSYGYDKIFNSGYGGVLNASDMTTGTTTVELFGSKHRP